MESQTTIRRNPKAVYRSLRNGDGGVVLHLDSGQYHGLNGVGASLWELIDGSRTIEEIATEFRRLCEDAPNDLIDIVATFCAGLRDRDLISTSD